MNVLTEEDKDDLRKRVVDSNSSEYPRDAVHLFAEKEGIYKHNEKIMNGIDGEEVDIPCLDTVASANISQKRARELISKLPDDPEKTANMEKVLTVKVGMKYNISVNVNVEDGLANGTTGKVKFIEYKIEGSNRPSIIWMKFEDPRIGKATREKYFQRGFFIIQIFKQTGLQYWKLKETFCTNTKCIREYNSHCDQQLPKQSTKVKGSQKMR